MSTDLSVVSVSLGSGTRDTEQVIELLGRTISVRRVGMDGDFARAGDLIAELDGQVDAIGLGGIDLYFTLPNRRYYVQDAVRLANRAKHTAVVCGAGLKNSLEKRVVQQLDASLNWSSKKVLMVSAVDRFGMASELVGQGADTIFGDLMFALGLPVAVHSIKTLNVLATTLLPIIGRLPFKWVYPVGAKQEEPKLNKRHEKLYNWADVIAGDWHFIRKYAPGDLTGKTLLTNTTTPADLEYLRSVNCKQVITTTMRLNGRSIGTNLLEAAFVALAGAKSELPVSQYLELLDQTGVHPEVLAL